jgi:nucleotidyltransferase substrate binding protein (TIGR01987 family)
MAEQDIRWEQRFSSYKNALTKLEDAVKYIEFNFLDEDNPDEKENAGFILNDLIKQGLIQSFEFTHELAWNVIKDYAAYQGIVDVRGSRDAARQAFAMNLVSNGEVWMEMIKSRNETSHTYNEETANEIFSKIIDEYLPAFLEFRDTMEKLRSGKQGDTFKQK